MHTFAQELRMVYASGNPQTKIKPKMHFQGSVVVCGMISGIIGYSWIMKMHPVITFCVFFYGLLLFWMFVCSECTVPEKISLPFPVARHRNPTLETILYFQGWISYCMPTSFCFCSWSCSCCCCCFKKTQFSAPPDFLLYGLGGGILQCGPPPLVHFCESWRLLWTAKPFWIPGTHSPAWPPFFWCQQQGCCHMKERLQNGPGATSKADAHQLSPGPFSPSFFQRTMQTSLSALF